MSEQVANEQHPLIKKIAEYCKVLSVKVEQMQRITIGDAEGTGQTPSYYWIVALPDLKQFAFKDIGDVATALNMVSAYSELSNQDKAADSFTTRGVQIIEKKIAEISGDTETLDQVANEAMDDDGAPAFEESQHYTAVKLDSVPPPAEVHLAGSGGSQFAERQKARALASTRPSLIKTQSSSGAKAPVVVGSKTLV